MPLTPLAEEAIGAGMGIVGGMIGDGRQRRQNKKLMKQQIKGAKEMADYNYMKQLEMWKATNYSAQMRELEAAGLNPGLIYGMSGGGGATTGSGGGGMPSGATAENNGGQIMQGVAMGMQNALLESQKRVLDTQADKNAAEAEATSGVKTDLGRTQIESLTQGIENAKQQQALTKIQTEIAALDAKLKGMTIEDQADYIEHQANKMIADAQIAFNEEWISKNTRVEKMNIIKTELVGKLLQNTLTKKVTNKTVADTQLSTKNYDKIAQQLMIEWDKLNLENRKVRLAEMLGMSQDDPLQKSIPILEEAIEGILKKRGTDIPYFVPRSK